MKLGFSDTIEFLRQAYSYLFGGKKQEEQASQRRRVASPEDIRRGMRPRYRKGDGEGKYVVKVEGHTARIIESGLIDTSSVEDKLDTPQPNILTEGGIISKNEQDQTAVNEALLRIAERRGMNVYRP